MTKQATQDSRKFYIYSFVIVGSAVFASLGVVTVPPAVLEHNYLYFLIPWCCAVHACMCN